MRRSIAPPSRGIEVAEVKHERAQRLHVDDPAHRHHRPLYGRAPSPATHVLAGKHPRIVDIKGIGDRGRVRPAHALPHQTTTKPGLHRPAWAPSLGENKVNIATFHLGRDKPGAGSGPSPWSRSDQPISPALLGQGSPAGRRRGCRAKGGWASRAATGNREVSNAVAVDNPRSDASGTETGLSKG